MYQAECPNCKKWTNISQVYGTFSCFECNHKFEIPEIQIIKKQDPAIASVPYQGIYGT